MGLPVLSKTWSFVINNAITATGTQLGDAQALLFGIKNALVTLGWTVVRSSNSVSVANSDLWAATTNIIFASSNRSWIVLQNTSLGTNFQIVLDCNGNAPTSMFIGFAQGGYNTGTGATNARPTTTLASDEVALINSNVWGLQSSGTTNYTWHASASTDLQCTRVIICCGGQAVGFFMFDKPQSPVSGWSTNPHACMGAGMNTITNVITHNLTYAGANIQVRFISGLGTATLGMYLGSEGFNNESAVQQLVTASDQDAAWALTPISLWSLTSPARGRNGQIFDLWYGVEILTTGTSYPASGTLYQFVQFGVLVFPWQSGTAPLTA